MTTLAGKYSLRNITFFNSNLTQPPRLQTPLAPSAPLPPASATSAPTAAARTMRLWAGPSTMPRLPPRAPSTSLPAAKPSTASSLLPKKRSARFVALQARCQLAAIIYVPSSSLSALRTTDVIRCTSSSSARLCRPVRPPARRPRAHRTILVLWDRDLRLLLRCKYSSSDNLPLGQKRRLSPCVGFVLGYVSLDTFSTL